VVGVGGVGKGVGALVGTIHPTNENEEEEPSATGKKDEVASCLSARVLKRSSE